MGLPKGRTNNSKGRPVGGGDIRREFKTTRDVLIARGLDPADALAEIALDMSVDVKTRVAALKELYLRSEGHIKQVEHSISEKSLSDIKQLTKDMLELTSQFTSEY